MVISMELLLLLSQIFGVLFILWGVLRLAMVQRKKPVGISVNEVPFGYRGLPGIGILVSLIGPGCQRRLIKIREQYGKICKVQMGSFACVWLNDYNLIKEAWNNNEFCGRPDLQGISVRSRGFKGGIIFNDGKHFTEQRRFVMHTLKAIGFGKRLSEQFILEEVDNVVAILEKQEDCSISTRHLFNIPAFNIIWRIINGGARFQENDIEMSKLVEVLNRNLELNDGACAAFFMPWLSKHFGKMIGWKSYVDDANFIFDFWMRFAEDATRNHFKKKNDGDYTGYHNSLLNLYCDKINDCSDLQSSFYGEFGVKSLATVLQDLFIAGSETTATTLQWICLYLAAFQDCQEKIFKDISKILDEVNSIDDTPTSSLLLLRSQLPYTEAFIKESLRFSTLAPLGMVHSTTEDLVFHGFFIPKNTLVHMNACAAHYDKTYWTNPEKFHPERFLAENGNLKTGEIPGFLPFSLGKRQCPGAEVAKQTLFLATVALVKRFEIRTDDTKGIKNSGAVELRPKIGVSAIPYPHKLRFIKRAFHEKKIDF